MVVATIENLFLILIPIVCKGRLLNSLELIFGGEYENTLSISEINEGERRPSSAKCAKYMRQQIVFKHHTIKHISKGKCGRFVKFIKQGVPRMRKRVFCSVLEV